MSNTSADDVQFLRTAGRLALRGHGGAEPNPMVGCVIVNNNETVGWGYHRRCGGPHAEIHALQRAGARADGSTVYITLEPCNNSGRTGPCSEALIRAGVARVVYARRDLNPHFAGGAERLREAGIAVEEIQEPLAMWAGAAFAHRIETGLPWVIAKWAQTVDGRIATRTGKSQWISNPQSRRLVHRQRGRVDAVLTGIGTVLADDPLLTPRDVRIRRSPMRVVIDPKLQTPVSSALVQTARDVRTVIACRESLLAVESEAVVALRARGVEFIGIPLSETDDLPVRDVLQTLASEFGVATVLVEAGAGLMGRLFRAGLVNQAWMFMAPLLLGDVEALPAVRGIHANELTDGIDLQLQLVRRRGDDLVVYYGVRSDR